MSLFGGKKGRTMSKSEREQAEVEREREEQKKKEENFVIRTYEDALYRRYEFLQGGLKELIQSVDLMQNASEVIACLNDSPRFKRHLCRVAEQTLEAKRKELEEAEKAVKQFCHIGEA